MIAQKSSSTMSSVKHHNDDVGGTSHLIARGRVDETTEKKLHQLKESAILSQEKIQAHLHHGLISQYNHEKRRDLLRKDDSNMQLNQLDPSKRRALLKRQRNGVKDRALKSLMIRTEKKNIEAAIAASDAERILSDTSGFIQVENEMEKTFKLTQQNLKKQVDEQTARNIYDLNLSPYSPYGISFDRSGRCGILYGKSSGGGHCAVMDMYQRSLVTEFHVQEKIRDAVFLHNTSLFALAQQKNVFIYDNAGVEIHRMSDHQDVFRMQYLPHHWLLSTVGRTGFLKYHDTSTGNLISTHRSKLGPCDVMTQNPTNAIIHLGHLNGVVTLWSPASSEYLVKMLCHKGAPVRAAAVDNTGRYMVTGGAENQIKVWDLRMYKETHAYYSRGGPPTCIDISQRGVLGVGHGSHTTFWSPDALKYKVKDPYMSHSLPGCGPVESLRFRGFEDVCGIGHTKGFSSIVIPGSGEPNLDSMEYNTNPYHDNKQRREGEVRALMDKLSPDMIALDPDVIGTVEVSDPHLRLEKIRELEEEANTKKQNETKPKEKKKMRGRSKISKKLKRKQKNVIDESLVKLKEAKNEEKVAKKMRMTNDQDSKSLKDEAPKAIKRFFKN